MRNIQKLTSAIPLMLCSFIILMASQYAHAATKTNVYSITNKDCHTDTPIHFLIYADDLDLNKLPCHWAIVGFISGNYKLYKEFGYSRTWANFWITMPKGETVKLQADATCPVRVQTSSQKEWGSKMVGKNVSVTCYLKENRCTCEKK